MVIGQPLLTRDLGIDADGLQCVTSRVNPVGWTLSVGIAQLLAPRLATLASAARGAGLPPDAQIRRDLSLHGASACTKSNLASLLWHFSAPRPSAQPMRAAYRHP